MPRSGTVGTASQPPGTTPQQPNTVIQSAVWNAAMDDIYQIFNTIQPVAYGGTGRATAAFVAQKVFTASGTYTPTTGMTHAIIECWGAGAGGGGVAGAAGEIRSASGGGAGGYSRKLVLAATISASATVTVGAGGAGGAAGANNGVAGGDTSVDALCIAKGGSPGIGNGTSTGVLGGLGGVPGTGDIAAPGQSGQQGICATIITINFSTAMGGSTSVGAGGRPRVIDDTNTQTAATGYGAGGAGAAIRNNAVNIAGGAGTSGLVVITEFCV